MADPAKTCRLLTLPAEIRVAIWEILLIQPTPYLPPSFLAPAAASAASTLAATAAAAAAATSTTREARQARPRYRLSAAVLETCRQIHAEGTPILYQINTFLAHASLLSTWPSLLTETHPRPLGLAPITHTRVIALIRRFYLQVRLDTDPQFTRAQAQDSFSGCDALCLDVFQAMYGGCDFGVLALFEGVRGVGVAMVQGSTGDGRYARWLEASMMSPLGSEVQAFQELDTDSAKEWHAWANGNG